MLTGCKGWHDSFAFLGRDELRRDAESAKCNLHGKEIKTAEQI